jgi:hypothetical protein
VGGGGGAWLRKNIKLLVHFPFIGGLLFLNKRVSVTRFSICPFLFFVILNQFKTQQRQLHCISDIAGFLHGSVFYVVGISDNFVAGLNDTGGQHTAE